MKIKKIIENLQVILQEEGDLESFDYDSYSIDSINVQEKNDRNYPDDWNMPEKFVVFGSPR